MVKRPTIHDLASAAGVSVATVDRVLNRRQSVSHDTMRRITSAAEAIGFRAASQLKQQQQQLELPSRKLGFLLYPQGDPFMQTLAAELMRSLRRARGISGDAVFEPAVVPDPGLIAEQLVALGQKCDAVAVASFDHPLVSEAVAKLVAAGKPVFSLLNDLTAPSRHGCFAMDGTKAGRMAAWLMARLVHRPGKLAVLMGSRRYLGQVVTEHAFCQYVTRHGRDLALMPTLCNLDDARASRDAVLNLVQTTPDLVGVYACGGSRAGIVGALRDCGTGERIVTIMHELTEATRLGLEDGTVDVVLATPLRQLARATVGNMLMSLQSPLSSRDEAPDFLPQVHLRSTIYKLDGGYVD